MCSIGVEGMCENESAIDAGLVWEVLSKRKKKRKYLDFKCDKFDSCQHVDRIGRPGKDYTQNMGDSGIMVLENSDSRRK